MADEFKDQTGELMAALQDAMKAYADPVNHPTARWRDVEDARQAVLDYRSGLYAAGILKRQPTPAA